MAQHYHRFTLYMAHVVRNTSTSRPGIDKGLRIQFFAWFDKATFL